MTILDPLALWGVQGMSHDEARALIAAAYEMREVLRDAVRHSDTYPSKTIANWELYNRATAVIAQTEASAIANSLVPTMEWPADWHIAANAPVADTADRIDIPAFLRKHGMQEETGA
jgi:hypothetical protein